MPPSLRTRLHAQFILSSQQHLACPVMRGQLRWGHLQETDEAAAEGSNPSPCTKSHAQQDLKQDRGTAASAVDHGGLDTLGIPGPLPPAPPSLRPPPLQAPTKQRGMSVSARSISFDTEAFAHLGSTAELYPRAALEPDVVASFCEKVARSNDTKVRPVTVLAARFTKGAGCTPGGSRMPPAGPASWQPAPIGPVRPLFVTDRAYFGFGPGQNQLGLLANQWRTGWGCAWSTLCQRCSFTAVREVAGLCTQQ
jgi:hypothetical protein